uniref:Uncharacterized protein n=1 Tax=Salix viminalis TaxID=40686 RepID=A0A6N2MS67_SALVM
MKAGNCARQMKIFFVLKTSEKDDEAKFATLPGSPSPELMRILLSNNEAHSSFILLGPIPFPFRT